MKITLVLGNRAEMLEITGETAIRDLKSYIETITEIPASQQKLFILKDTSKHFIDGYPHLESIPDESEIFLDSQVSSTYFIGKLASACTNDSLSGLYLALRDYQIARQVSLKKEELLNIINTLYEDKWNCLHYACNGGHFEIAKNLISIGSNVNITSYDNWTPLQLVSYNGFIEIASLLLSDPHIQVNKLTVGRGTALHMACLQNHDKMVKLLLHHSANFYIENDVGQIPMELTSSPEICNIIAIEAGNMILGKYGMKNQPDRMSGFAHYTSPYQIRDSFVYLVVDTENGYFLHYKSESNEIADIEISILEITSVYSSAASSKFFFIIEHSLGVLYYYTESETETEQWVDRVKETVEFFQSFVNNRRLSNRSYTDFQRRKTVTIKYTEEKEEVNIDNFDPVREIGQGSFGTIVLAVYQDTEYALKILDKESLERANMIKYAVAECKVLQKIDHRFAIKMFWAFQTKEHMYIVMEYCPYGDLSRLLHMYGKFNEEQAAFYIVQIVDVIGYLHRKEIIYRDLKPANILVDERGYIKLTDFGLATENTTSLNPAKTFCGSPAYMSPEIIAKEGSWKAADVYSIGAVLYELLTGSPPFFTEDVDILYQRISCGDIEFPDSVSKNAKELIASLTNKNAQERPSIEDIFKHKFFRQVDIQVIIERKVDPPVDLQAFRNN